MNDNIANSYAGKKTKKEYFFVKFYEMMMLKR